MFTLKNISLEILLDEICSYYLFSVCFRSWFVIAFTGPMFLCCVCNRLYGCCISIFI